MKIFLLLMVGLEMKKMAGVMIPKTMMIPMVDATGYYCGKNWDGSVAFDAFFGLSDDICDSINGVIWMLSEDEFLI